MKHHQPNRMTNTTPHLSDHLIQCIADELIRDEYEARQRLALAKRQAIEAAQPQRKSLAVSVSSTVS